MIADLRPPTCAVCRKPVDNFEHHQNPLSNEIVFIATCHGEKQVVKFTDKELACITRLWTGVAFQGAE